MKVILRQNVENLGSMGEIVTVKDGYARNYLIPNSLAYIATAKAEKVLEQEKKLYAKKMAQEKSAAELVAQQLAELQVSIAMKVGEEGKLYGSVTPQMIAQELAVRGYNIDKRNILIEDPIRSLGVFDINVKLYHDVSASLKIWVISEE